MHCKHGTAGASGTVPLFQDGRRVGTSLQSAAAIRGASTDVNEASNLIASRITLALKPYSDGDFVKQCTMKVAELVCPEK